MQLAVLRIFSSLAGGWLHMKEEKLQKCATNPSLAEKINKYWLGNV
jgi:hypothetical protein